MAERRNPGVEELNAAIGKHERRDPAEYAGHLQPEVDPRVLTGEGIPAHEMALGLTHRSGYLGISRELRPIADDPPSDDALHPPAEEREELLGGKYAGTTRQEANAAHARDQAVAGKRPSVVPLHTKSASCFAWTPRQMLQEFIDAIDRGEEVPAGMVIIYTEQDERQRTSVHSWRAQLDWCEEYTYLEVAQQKCIDMQKV